MNPGAPQVASSGGARTPNVVQIVLGSDDLPFSKHLYSTVFGFAVAGERLVYTEHNGQVMGFGGWGGATILYMVGRQEMLQLEFWTHTRPPQRPRPRTGGRTTSVSIAWAYPCRTSTARCGVWPRSD